MKFFGKVGYCWSEEGTGERRGIWDDYAEEHEYYGDVLSNNRRWEQGTSINDDLNVTNRISIVADAFAWDHFFAIKYIEWMGQKWKVTGVEVARPRLILQIGGVWNGPEKD
jgi:hypothetical protein